jgi:acyl-coenzyme A synthetase/AMP-(fatty) acid ligase
MTETLAVVLYRDLERSEEASQAAPQAEVQVDDLPTEPGLPMRLWFRHPSVALGYFRWPDLQDRNFRDGWCSTGDLFFSREREQWEFAGRNDALVKINSRWVSTLELQRELGNDLSADVQDLAVAALIGDEGLTGIALFVVPRPGRESEARAG